MTLARLTRLRLRTIVIASACALLGATGSATVASAQPASPPTTYWVDCSSRVSGDGSAESPWNSLTSVNTHTAFHPGERILLKRRTTCVGSLHPRGNGAKGSPITLGAYGTGAKPTINGRGTRNHTGAVQLKNQQWWTVQDLHVTNRSSAAETKLYRSGVLVLNEQGGRLSGITIRRLQVDGVTSNLMPTKGEPRDYGGISAITSPYFTKGSGFDGLVIQGNRVSKVGRSGIVVSNYYPRESPDRGLRITGNKITRARGDSIMIRGAVGARIDHNIVAYGADFWPCKQCGRITPQTANAGIWPLASTGTTIEYNEVYGMHKLGGDGEGIDVDIDSKNTVVQYNYVHDNQGGGILFCGSDRSIARFNILENNQLGAFTFIGSIPASNTSIYNNTVYSRVGNDAKVVRTFAGQTGKKVTFINNLIYNMDDSGFYVWPTKPKSRTNTYIGVHGIGEPSEAGKGWTDPGLRAPGTGGIGMKSVSGYRPVSPKDDPAGSPVPKTVRTDFFGKKIDPKRPPRGAAG